VLDWLKDDISEAGKWPLMLCFLAFVLTFLWTRGVKLYDGERRRGPIATR
jgi:hypothetical protein